jgi:hypothetical protein
MYFPLRLLTFLLMALIQTATAYNLVCNNNNLDSNSQYDCINTILSWQPQGKPAPGIYIPPGTGIPICHKGDVYVSGRAFDNDGALCTSNNLANAAAIIFGTCGARGGEFLLDSSY